MDNFLTTLRIELFNLNKKEKRLIQNTEFDPEIATVKNDQSIAEINTERINLLTRLIEIYLNK